ncbi:MAG TPA: helix-turn-helix transcriptional regulator [Verrucomicrobiota bacterium]|nr:helix-turn-helix transcriptional regulator [Verrucomicrobiota bacterium]
MTPFLIEREKKTAAKRTGRRYATVEDLMSGEAVAPEVRTKFAEFDRETRIVQNLVEMRQSAGLTQHQLAEMVGKTQGAISKLESSADDEITIRELCEYAKATSQQFVLAVGKPMNHVESVKWHAFGIKEHLSALAKMAHQDLETEQAIQAFFGEAFFNILTILGNCQQDMPNGKEVQVRLRRVSRATRPNPNPKPGENTAA